ncbi:MAG: endolytic transglycosylase MltG [Chloroflexi bacterium]|nr:endolytic transglycosylase MltG [Chloroflexota bacterium]
MREGAEVRGEEDTIIGKKSVGCVWKTGLGLVVLAGVLAAIIFFALRQNPSLVGPFQRIYLQVYLTSRSEQLAQPAGTGNLPVPFAVAPGETADTIAANLVAAGLLDDAELFLNYVRFYGLDSGLEAGDFTLTPAMTIPDLAVALTEGQIREIELTFLEGWRLEEMAASLAKTNPAAIDADQFLMITRRQNSFDLSTYDFLASLPPEATLEGYLFPDTYRVPPDADATYLVDAMLQNFGRRVTPEMRQAFGGNGLSLREAVTLASVVEREAAVDEERPFIANVFYNRLNQGMRLEADPTTQYALGYQQTSGSWWKNPLYLDDLAFDSPYNTYTANGLPPGPIANPGLASLQAVAAPAQTEYLFFVVDCTAVTPGSHVFSVTYEEHLANVERCR